MGLNPTFVSILRNIKGLLYLPPGGWDLELISWLKRKYRYRMVGLPTALLSEFPGEKEILSKSPFKTLVYPSVTVRSLVERIVEKVNCSDVVESVVLASCYVTPIVTNCDGLRRLGKFSVYEVLSEKPLPENEIIRHLRIVGYTILDSHEKLCWSAYKKIAKACRDKIGGVVNRLLEERRAFAEKDSKRYWRFKSEKGKPVIIYLDILKAFNDIEVCDLIQDESLALALGLVPAIKVEV